MTTDARFRGAGQGPEIHWSRGDQGRSVSVMVKLSFLIVAALVGSCSHVMAEVRGDAAILPETMASRLLAQCSRPSPERGEDTWTPEWADIEALEANLAAALMASEEAGTFTDRQPPEGWARQYVGLIRNGRRFIYGNFLPKGVLQGRSPAELVIVCDGGPAMFGVEYDVDAGRFSHVAFNGRA